MRLCVCVCVCACVGVGGGGGGEDAYRRSNGYDVRCAYDKQKPPRGEPRSLAVRQETRLVTGGLVLVMGKAEIVPIATAVCLLFPFTHTHRQGGRPRFACPPCLCVCVLCVCVCVCV